MRTALRVLGYFVASPFWVALILSICVRLFALMIPWAAAAIREDDIARNALARMAFWPMEPTREWLA